MSKRRKKKAAQSQHAQKRGSKKRKAGKQKRKPKQAETADRHELYEKAVQAPEMDVEFYDETYRKLRGRKPMVLREDFCGTAYLSSTWCESDPKRTAIGVDFDAEVLEWGRARYLDGNPDLSKRVQLIEGNVLEPIRAKADITCAMNFSYCVFKTRDELRKYFELAREGLKKDGLFICELYGGTEAVVELEDVDEKDGFTYHWDQDKYDPITHHTLCHIHFSFSDGSKLEKAFTYDWRLWTIPELRELLEEAGFSHVRIFWEEMEDDDDDDDDDEDEELEGTGEYIEVEETENQEAWLCYIVAER
jgi:SAM-dependent methyltransferase